MRTRIVVLLTVVILSLVSCKAKSVDALPSQPPSDETSIESSPPPGVSTDPFDVDLSDLEIFRAGLIEEAKPVLDELTQNTIYQMDWEISPDLTTLNGTMIISLTNREDVALESIYLRLFPNISGGKMSISNLKIAGEDVGGVLERGDSVLRIDLAAPIEPGTQVSLSCSFEVQLPLEMSGNYGLFGSFDGLLVLQEAYPIIPVYDTDGWDVDLPAPHGDLTYLDMSYYVVRISLPAELQVIASGYTLDHRAQDGRQTVTFVAGPARDFYFAAGKYQKVSDRYGETIINSYFLPEAEPSTEASLTYGKAAIAILNDRLMKYPYTEFDMLTTPMLALGIEYPGVTALNIDMYDPGAEISGMQGTFFLESVIAHEIAHQWYYNLVGNDQLDHPWLDEALVQYLTGIYFLDAYGDNAYQGFRQSWVDRWERVERENIPIGLPASQYDGLEYGAIVYGRGPLFVEALADEMGDDLFWEFFRSFTANFAWELAQPAEFMEMAESTCDCDLGPIWEAWGVLP